MDVGDQVPVRQTLAGDPDAFGTLVERYSGLVYSLVLEVVRRPEDVEDLAQEAFCRAYQELPSLRQPAKFAPWLAQIAHRTALGWLRHEQARTKAEEQCQPWTAPAPGAPPDHALEVQERADLLWEALDQLPSESRRVVALYYLEGCTFREIARFLGLPLATVRWRLLRSEHRLGQELGRILGQAGRLGHRHRQELRGKVLSSLPLGLWPALGQRAISKWSLGVLSQRLLPWTPAAVLVGLVGSGVLYLVGLGTLDRWWGGEGSDLPIGSEQRSGWTTRTRIQLGSPSLLPEQLELPRPSQDLSSLPEVQELLSARLPADSLAFPGIDPLFPHADEQQPGAQPAERLSGLSRPPASPGRRLPADQARSAVLGAWGGDLALADLVRFLDDHTQVRARVLEAVPQSGLHFSRLMQAPVHFLLNGAGLYRGHGYGALAEQLSPDEAGLLGQYLSQGGFLYVEGDQLFLRDMVQLLRQALEGRGRLLEVPLSHPLYHAFYDLDGGFPGEADKGRYTEVPGADWYYPANKTPSAADTLGVWGVELDGELVVLLNEGVLLRNWEPDMSADEAAALGRDAPIKYPKLMAATNVVVYALTRPHGLALRQGLPPAP